MAMSQPYQAYAPSENVAGRQCMEDVNRPFEPLRDRSISIITSKPAESLCLLLKNVDDGVSRFAIRKRVDDRVSKQVGARSPIEIIQGRFEE
jgi:hypothetical protein